jgi:hypothetical protein
MVEEIIILPLEAWVRLLLYLEHNIAWLDTWKLVTLAPELNLVSAPNASVDVDVQDFPFNDGLLSGALFTPIPVADDLALALAVVADSLEPLNHGTHLSHHVLHTATITASTLLDSTILATTAFAFGANDGLLQGKLRNLSSVDVL